jgi:prepilin-type N-terminal cleavage/methylation domain-containing protein
MKQQGFTFVEVMVVTSIIGILAMIAVPTYRAFLETAETTSDTVEGTGERIALALESLEGPAPVSSSGSSPAAPSTLPTSEPSAPPVASTPTGNTEPSTPPSSSMPAAGTPPTSSTTSGATPQQEPPPPVSTGSETASNAAENPASSGAGSTGGGGSNNSSAQANIQVQDQYKQCSSESGNCKVKAGDDFEVSFNLQSLGKISEKDIKLVTTGGAKVDNFSYDSKKGTLEVEMEAPDNKNKTFSLMINAGKEKSTLYFKTS